MTPGLSALTDLALFVEVARAQSFSHAALRLDMPASTLSRRIAAMERRLGIQLFQRTTRRVTLAQAAIPYFQCCEEVLEAARRAQAVIEDSGAIKGTVRVSMPVDLGVELIGPAIARILPEHPELSVQFDLSSRMVDLLRDPIDLAFRIGNVQDGRVVARKIGAITSGIYVAPSYLHRHGGVDNPARLEEACCLDLLTASGPMPWAVGQMRWKQAPGRRVASANSVALLRAFAEQGLGVALLPDHVVRDSLASGRLVRLLADEKTPSWPVHAVSARRSISREARVLIACVKDALAHARLGHPASTGSS